MTDEQNTKRINRITEIIQKYLEGNFSFRIPSSGKNDGIDILTEKIFQLFDIIENNITAKSETDTSLRKIIEKYRLFE